MIQKVGALWQNNSQNPKAPFAHGEIELDGKKVKVVVWRNKSENPKAPQYTIALDTYERPQQPASDEFTDEIPF